MSDLALQRIEIEKRERTGKLDISNFGLMKLPSELGKLEWLTELNFSMNHVSDLKPLLRLTELIYLDFRENQVSDLRPLIKLTKVVQLGLADNNVSDLTPLEKLTGLTSLDFRLNQVSDLTPLEKLTGLMQVDFSRNQVSDLKPLEKLTELTNLYFWNNKVSDLTPLEKLTGLKNLQFGVNQVSDLTPLEKLAGLTQLDFWGNLVSDLTPLGKLKGLTQLYFSGNLVSGLTPLEKLTGLKNLQFGGNQVSDLTPLQKLTGLTLLDFGVNQVSDLMPLEKLTGLTQLYFANNQVSDLTPLEKLTGLTQLSFEKNQVSDLTPLLPFLEKKNLKVVLTNSNYLGISDGEINAYGNPLQTPPPETVQKGTQAILDYFRELEQQGIAQLYEAKMLIIGEGGSGKTTLYRKLTGDPAMPAEKDTTRGIDIHALPIPSKEADKPFTMHIWDFGGQEIYHATHQFFLTKRSLYVLVTDNRKEENHDYWLQVQKLYGEKSPMVVVQNEKGGRKKALPLNEMRASFPNVQAEFFALDLSLENEIDRLKFTDLRAYIERAIQALPHIGTTFPKQWFVIRNVIEEVSKQKPYISQEAFFEMCAANKLPEEERALQLSEYLHDLGVFLHFQDDVLLSETLFLQNAWVTDGVFALIDSLNNREVPEKWQFDENTAKGIWYGAQHDGRYKGKVAELIALIEKFELCYEVSKKTYLMPQLLPGTRPVEAVEARFGRKGAMQLHFEYGFMPKGLLSRLMVRLHRFIVSQEVIWNSGMLLEHGGYQAQAEVVETYGERDIRVWVKGTGAQSFSTVLVDEIKLLNSTYGENLEVTTFLPCVCHTCRHSDKPNFYDHEALKLRQERGKPTIECAISYDNVSVQQILENVFVTPKKMDSLKVFISYSKADEAHKEALLTHLKPLQRSEGLLTWNDRNLLPGEDWDERIKRELTAADIVLVLLSADALATDYIWDFEIKQAVQQSASGKSAVIPILLRPCDWMSSPLAKLSALPFKAKPVAQFADKDEAWQQVVKGIREVVERVKAWR